MDTWVFTEQTVLSMPTPQECDGSYAYKHEKEPSSFLGRIFMDLRCSPSTLQKFLQVLYNYNIPSFISIQLINFHFRAD